MDVASYQKSKSLSVTQLAMELGCSKGHASDLARGKRKPGRKIALRLEMLTGRPWHEFVNAEQPQ